MTAKRETFFRCTFSSAQRREVGHVAAWDAKEAVLLFEAELQNDGVSERGTIEVTSPAGLTRRGAYRPAPAARAHAHAAGV